MLCFVQRIDILVNLRYNNLKKGGAIMRKMKILLSSGSSVGNYIAAIEGVGAEAVAKYLPEIDTDYDGLILCGGGDIDPKYYKIRKPPRHSI